jgi:hypothetical protein
MTSRDIILQCIKEKKVVCLTRDLLNIITLEDILYLEYYHNFIATEIEDLFYYSYNESCIYVSNDDITNLDIALLCYICLDNNVNVRIFIYEEDKVIEHKFSKEFLETVWDFVVKHSAFNSNMALVAIKFSEKMLTNPYIESFIDNYTSTSIKSARKI